MKPFIADADLGFCAACGVQVCESEWAITRGGETTHATCTPRPRATPRQAEPQSSMFLFDDQPREIIESAKETTGATRIAFDGVSVLPIDTPRLAGQLAAVFELMRDGKFRKLSEIAEVVGCLETSASARLRDFRKARNGGHDVAVRYIGNGVNEYKLILKHTGELEHGERAA